MINQIEPWIDNEELIQLTKVIESTQITEGPMTNLFEKLTSDLVGARHAIAFTNGSVALFSILKSLDIGPGDEVIIPNLTFIATATAVILAGATPVLCDIQESDLGLDPIEVKKLITQKTKAIIVVHLYGNAADIDEIKNICEASNLYLVEDAAQGVGVAYKGQHVGQFGIAGILSYYGNKTITCGEGGIVLTNSNQIRDAVYSLKNHGRLKKGIFVHDKIGFNFAFTEMQAAIGVAQMGKLERIIKAKEDILERYKLNLPEFTFFEKSEFTTKYVPWFSSVKVADPQAVQKVLLERGVGSRRFFPPLSSQPCLANLPSAKNTFPVSEKIYGIGLSLPSSAQLSTHDQDIVISAVQELHE